MMEALLKKYLDPKNPGSFGGIDRLLRSATDVTSDREEVVKALQNNDVYTLNKENRHKFPRNPVIVTNVQQQYQVDLADMSTYHAENDDVHFLLVAIDCFSKEVSVQPLKNKEGRAVKVALEIVFEEIGLPEKIQFDKGKEFWNKCVKDFLQQKQVTMFTSENDDIKCCMAERFIRTLKNRIWRYFRHISATRYIDKIQDFVHSYNNSVHLSHGKLPADVTQDNSLQVFHALYGKLLNEKTKKVPRYRIGDIVRMSKNKKTFEKGYESRFKPTMYEISRIIRHCIPLYELKCLNTREPIKGRFYETELSLVRNPEEWTYKIEKVLEREKRGRVWWKKVRWLGYEPESDSWIRDNVRRK